MVNITKSGSSLLITSNDNHQFPWKDGQMSIPMNSVTYVIDESDFIAFKSAANGDILFTANIEELVINGTQATRDNIIELFDSVANSVGSGGGSSAGVESINGETGAVTLKTINNNSLIGEGNIEISGGGSETDPIFTEWKDRDYVTLGNGATDSGEANGIVIGYNASGNTNTISIGYKANAVMNSIAIGKQATTTKSNGIAIGNELGGVQTDSTYKINIGNTFKGDTSNYAYVLNEYGNYVRIPTEWTGTQSEYDALGAYYDNVTYNIIEG